MTDENAKNQVDAFLKELHTRYGVSEGDVSGLLRQLARLQKRTAFAQRMGEWTAKTIIVVLVGSFFSGVAWAFVHFIEIVKAGTH